MPVSKEKLREYLQALAKDKNFDEEKTAKLLSLATGDGDIQITADALRDVLQPIIELPVGRQADYSKAWNELNSNIQAWRKWKADVEKTHSEAVEKLKKFESKYGPLEDIEDQGGGKGVTPEGKTVSMDKVNELLAESRQGIAREMLSFTLDSQRLSVEHFKRFKELPDIPALMKLYAEKQEAGERDVTLDSVYEETYGPRIKEHAAAEEKARIDKLVADRMKEMGVRETKPSGAEVSEEGSFWDRQGRQEKAASSDTGNGKSKGPDDSDKSKAPMSEEERIAAFNQDFEQELAKASGSS